MKSLRLSVWRRLLLTSWAVLGAACACAASLEGAVAAAQADPVSDVLFEG